MMKRNRQNRNGFTLIEIITVLGILMFLSGISYSVIFIIIREDELLTEGQQIADIIRLYASKARTKRIPHRIIFDFGRGSMRIFSAGPDRRFGTEDDLEAYEDDFMEEEHFLPRSMYFERAIMTHEEFEGPYSRPLTDLDEDLYDPNQNYTTGTLLLHPNRYIEMQLLVPGTGKVPENTGEEDEDEEEEETTGNIFDVPETKWIKSINADIIVAKYNERKRVLIDIRPLTGRVYVKVNALKVEEIEPEEPPGG
ncbi:MAG: type II secretion system protein [Planctomycetota bacterium]